MKLPIRKILIAVLACVFIFASGMMLWQYLNSRNAAQSNDLAQSLINLPSYEDILTVPPGVGELTPSEDTSEEVPVATPPDRHTQMLLQTDLSALQSINSDVIGWILIPGTDVNYPLLHTTDNSTYLHTAWDGSYNQAGSIFMETRTNPDMEDFNTIIYGHNMRNGSMFATLMRYKDAQYPLDYPYIYIVTKEGVYKYTIFAGYEAAVVSDTYRLIFKDDLEKQTAIDSYLERSVWESPVQPTVTDRVLTLSTCTGTGRYETRWVIQGMFSGFWAKTEAGIQQNTGLTE